MPDDRQETITVIRDDDCGFFSWPMITKTATSSTASALPSRRTWCCTAPGAHSSTAVLPSAGRRTTSRSALLPVVAWRNGLPALSAARLRHAALASADASPRRERAWLTIEKISGQCR